MRDTKAAEVCAKFCLGDMAKKLLTPEQSAEQYLETLVQNKQYIDAIRVLAYALPTKTAIAWANSCARSFGQSNSAEKFEAALAAVDKWLAEPNDANRRDAMKAAEVAKYDTPAGSAALAVFFSEGSIAPPDAPVVNAEEYQAPNAVVSSVLLAAVLTEPEKAEAKYQSFIVTGRTLAADRN